MQSNIAFVLGNGNSRKRFNINQLKEKGTVYACNAVYRDYQPDHLIAVDTKMITEINAAGYDKNNSVWSNPNKLTNRLGTINIMKPHKGWSSGPTALLLASQHGHKEIYILGFDYIGIGDNNEKVNNIFAGTKNYKKNEDRATYYGNWTRQTSQCINMHPRTKYYRVIPKDNYFVPDHLKDLQNLDHINSEIFTRKFKL